MRILYVSGSYVPSRRASSIQVMRMCAALARQGHEVTLVTKGCRQRQEAGVDDDFAFYGVEPAFRIAKLPRPARRGGGLRYLRGVLRLTDSRPAFDLYYCREQLAAWRLARRRRPVVFEAHEPPASWWARRLYRQLAGAATLRRLVVISAALGRRYGELGLLPAHGDTVVAHDAAEPLEVPAAPPAGGRAPRLGYVGHLYPGRGVEVLLGLARLLPACELHVIGGAEADLERWRGGERPPNLVFHGFVPPARLAALYAGLDVLLMPYQRHVGAAGGRADIGAWMSPMKLFEYMATGRPIVASNLPVLGEILSHEDNALLAEPSDLEAWRRAVRRLLDEPALARRLGETARRQQRRRHTWEARARAVLEDLPDGRG